MTWDVSTDSVEVEIDMATETPIAANWGEIGGTLSDQTDLQTALNAKLSEAPTDGKTYGRKNGAWAEVQGGGGGGGTSDHTQLANRDAANQHPISAVQGLQAALDAKADDSDIPTKTSDLTNDSGFLTQHQSLAGYATQAWVNAQGFITSLAGYATEAWVTAKNYATQAWVGQQGYLTQHQSLEAYRTSASQDEIDAAKASASDVDAIEAKIPAQATSGNQLADKNFVNSSIATNTAYYISNNGEPFTSLEQLQEYSGTVTNNDYAFVTGTDEQGNTYYDRYKATVSGSTVTWAKEYRLNNSSFTAAQWAAISSGITSAEVTKLAGIAAGAEVNVNADWNASSGDAQILNKPTIRNVPSSTSSDDGKFLRVNSSGIAEWQTVSDANGVSF